MYIFNIIIINTYIFYFFFQEPICSSTYGPNSGASFLRRCDSTRESHGGLLAGLTAADETAQRCAESPVFAGPCLLPCHDAQPPRVCTCCPDLNKNPIEGFSAGLVEASNPFEWGILIIGPPDTP